MKGHVASSISYLNVGGLYYSLNWTLFCYPSLEQISFISISTGINLYCFGESSEDVAEKYLKRINSYIGDYYNDIQSVFLIPKKVPFLILEKEEGFYKILASGRIGYIQALSLFKLRESVERI